MVRSLLLASALLVVLAACSEPNPTPSTTTLPVDGSTTVGVGAPTTSTSAAPTPETPPPPTVALVVPDVLGDFRIERAWIDGIEILVAVADTSELRRRGLMYVEDLGDLDGMVFVFESDSTGGFWMKNTLIQLDIAFFDAEGSFVDGFVMEPCATADCPSYRPSGSYRYALEMAAGTMPGGIETLQLDQ